MKRPLGIVLLLCLVGLPCYAIKSMMFNSVDQYIRTAHGIWIVEVTGRTTRQRGLTPLYHARILHTMKGNADERTLSVFAVSWELISGQRYLVFGFSRTPGDAAWLDNGNVSPVPIPVSFSLAGLRGKTVKDQISSIMAARCKELERLITQFQGEKSALENGLAFQERRDDLQRAEESPAGARRSDRGPSSVTDDVDSRTRPGQRHRTRSGLAEAEASFWTTLADGDAEALKRFYAERITLKAGSELLKPRWGIASDRGRDTTLARDKLMAGYGRMIEELGRDKWRRAFSKIGEDRLAVTVVAEPDQPFPGTRKGDRLLTVETGVGDDRLFYVFRRQGAEWRIVIEVTDY